MRFIIISLGLAVLASAASPLRGEDAAPLTPAAQKALARYNDAVAKARTQLAADLDKEIASVLKSGNSSALETATAIKAKKEELCSVTGELEGTLTANTWLYRWDSGSRVLAFKAKGVISEGSNDNENTWNLTEDGKLQLVTSAKKVFSTFTFDRDKGEWKMISTVARDAAMSLTPVDAKKR